MDLKNQVRTKNIAKKKNFDPFWKIDWSKNISHAHQKNLMIFDQNLQKIS